MNPKQSTNSVDLTKFIKKSVQRSIVPITSSRHKGFELENMLPRKIKDAITVKMLRINCMIDDILILITSTPLIQDIIDVPIKSIIPNQAIVRINV